MQTNYPRRAPEEPQMIKILGHCGHFVFVNGSSLRKVRVFINLPSFWVEEAFSLAFIPRGSKS